MGVNTTVAEIQSPKLTERQSLSSYLDFPVHWTNYFQFLELTSKKWLFIGLCQSRICSFLRGVVGGIKQFKLQQANPNHSVNKRQNLIAAVEVKQCWMMKSVFSREKREFVWKRRKIGTQKFSDQTNAAHVHNFFSSHLSAREIVKIKLIFPEPYRWMINRRPLRTCRVREGIFILITLILS